jgi:ribosomal protein S18 acetylase RimI-like enzyme
MNAGNLEDLRRQFEASRDAADWDRAAELSQRMIDEELAGSAPVSTSERRGTVVLRKTDDKTIGVFSDYNITGYLSHVKGFAYWNRDAARDFAQRLAKAENAELIDYLGEDDYTPAPSPSNIIIQRTTVRDQIDAIDIAYKQTGLSTEPKMQSAHSIIGEMMSFRYENLALVAWDNGELVGIMIYEVFCDRDTGVKEAHISELASLKSGVGRMLVMEVEQIAREEGCDLVTLSHGPGAKEFYEKLGYSVELGTVMVKRVV